MVEDVDFHDKNFRMIHKPLRTLFHEKMKTMSPKLLIAMGCYLVLILAALFTLEGFLRAAVLFFFAILVVKTIVHAEDERAE
jgi:hypothetical protein